MDYSDVYVGAIGGGKGERLSPYSNFDRPKQFCYINEDNRFIQQVVENFAKLGIPRSHFVVVVTNDRQHELACEQLVPRGVLSQNIVKISDHGYVWAMARATEIIREINPNSIVITTPSDPYIRDDNDEFKLAVDTAIAEARNNNLPVIVGVKINDLYVASGCGHAITSIPVSLDQCAPVVDFVEKPDLKKADELMRSGTAVCNTGINVWPAAYLSERFSNEELQSIGTEQFMKKMLSDLKVAMGTFQWYDCGTLHSLYKVSQKTPNHLNASFGGGKIDRLECLRSLFLCDPGYRLHAVNCVDVAVVVTTIRGKVTTGVIRLKESEKVKELAQKFSEDEKFITTTWSLKANNNNVLPSGITPISWFVGVDGYNVLVYKRHDDNEIDVYVIGPSQP